MPETLNDFIEKKIEELVENPEFHFHPSVLHFFRWSLRECAEKTVDVVSDLVVKRVDKEVLGGECYGMVTTSSVENALEFEPEKWLGTNDQPQ